jgi:hypothetical protein
MPRRGRIDVPRPYAYIFGAVPTLEEYLAGADVPAELDPETARALVAALVERRDAARLQALAQAGGAKLAKEARRGLHRLRSRGVSAEAPRAPRAPGDAVKPATEHGEAWASSPDGAGERLVSLVQPAAGGGWDVVHVRFSDEVGLLEAVRAQGPKKIWRGLLKKFEEADLVFAEVEPGYASWLVEEAYRKTSSLGRSPPQGFGSARTVLPPAAEPVRHPGEELAPAELAPEQARALHALPDLRSWVPSRDILNTLRLRLEEVEASQLFVDDRQKQEARLQAVDTSIETTFAGEARERWRRRLLDTAFVYHRAGRADDARRLRAQADRLANPGFASLADAFARALVEKLLPPELTQGRLETTLAP